MAKKKKSASPQQIIQELDKLSKKLKSKSYGEVALRSSLGLIYAWQKYKLENLKFALKHGGDQVGFIALIDGKTKAGRDALRVELILLPDSTPTGHYEDEDESRYERMQTLIASIDEVRRADDCGFNEDPDQRNERFCDDHEFCSECGHDNRDSRVEADRLFT